MKLLKQWKARDIQNFFATINQKTTEHIFLSPSSSDEEVMPDIIVDARQIRQTEGDTHVA